MSHFFSGVVPWTVFSIISGNCDHVTENREDDALARMRALLVDFDCVFGNGWTFVVEDDDIVES